MAYESPLYRGQTSNIDVLIARLASAQHGIVRLDQLRALGLDPRAVSKRVKHGRLHRVYRAVYAVGHAALSRDGEWLAAVLASGHGAALGARSVGPCSACRTQPSEARLASARLRVNRVLPALRSQPDQADQPNGREVESTTEDDDLSTDFPLQTSTSGDRRTLQGTVGHGGVKLELTTSHGNLELKKGSATPLPPPAPPAPPSIPKASEAPARHFKAPKGTPPEPTVQ